MQHGLTWYPSTTKTCVEVRNFFKVLLPSSEQDMLTMTTNPWPHIYLWQPIQWNIFVKTLKVFHKAPASLGPLLTPNIVSKKIANPSCNQVYLYLIHSFWESPCCHRSSQIHQSKCDVLREFSVQERRNKCKISLKREEISLISDWMPVGTDKSRTSINPFGVNINLLLGM